MIIAIYSDGSYEFISKNSVDTVIQSETLTGLIDILNKKELDIQTKQWKNQQFTYRYNSESGEWNELLY